MKKSLIIMTALIALMSSCAKELDVKQEGPKTTESNLGSESVIIYGSVSPTKTTVDGSGIFSWQTSETIAVVEQDMDGSSGTSFTGHLQISGYKYL